MKSILLNRVLRPELRQEPGQLPISSGSAIEMAYLRFRCIVYDITQNSAFKRASAILVVLSSTLLFFPVSSINPISLYLLWNVVIDEEQFESKTDGVAA